MNKVNLLARQLHQELLETSECQSYQQSLQALKKHSEIFALEKELKEMQKELLHLRTQENADTTLLMAQYEAKRVSFESHPLVVNYLSDKEDLESLCHFVAEAINGGLNEKC